ncbi:contractile injection system protein, VgrG/Pvc8 family [Photorhabdus namnaonensis]|uniref:Uncharacterized protein n=1 Tax=Photorhabdus namnaonensis TaxID=1851568 RepID=A0A1B8YG76_9GAMM|nr:contractile injection system protein, VgrG/Pvc8 family [Photorhabdus namnaonensis]OCA54062.1 hypothetical protein Phpb_02503 [Photorhabdus namnaonensis]
MSALLQVGIANIELKDRTFKNPLWGADYYYHERQINHQRSDLPSYTYYDFPGRFKDERGERMSQFRLEALRADTMFGGGQSDCFALAPAWLTALRDPQWPGYYRMETLLKSELGFIPD